MVSSALNLELGIVVIFGQKNIMVIIMITSNSNCYKWYMYMLWKFGSCEGVLVLGADIV